MPTRDHAATATAKRPGPWDRMERWQQIAALLLGAVAAVFAAGVTFQKAKASIVLVEVQEAIDARQDATLRAVQDDSLQMHVSMDDLHDEVRGMRTDLRFFDPRIRGGGLHELPPEAPRPAPSPTSTLDPSMGLPVPSSTSTSGP